MYFQHSLSDMPRRGYQYRANSSLAEWTTHMMVLRFRVGSGAVGVFKGGRWRAFEGSAWVSRDFTQLPKAVCTGLEL